MFPYCTNQPDNFETDRERVRILCYFGAFSSGQVCEARCVFLKIALTQANREARFVFINAVGS